ncbi:MAG: GNAT family N-acetyltransferase [Mycoplasmataceae bacterium]|jgi:putative acetyltransferase|nr:GNAT family N-acetyltransferase [Mycoplasmataceae bacterium]
MEIKEIILDETHKAALNDIWYKSAKHTHNFLSTADFEAIAPRVKSILQGKETAILVYEQNKIIAFSTIKAKHIESIFVLPEYIRQGIGSKIVEYAKQKHEVETVDVNKQNENAINFYKKHGFVISGETDKDAFGKGYPILHLHLKK